MTPENTEMRETLYITVFYDTLENAVALLREVEKDIWDCNKGSVGQGDNYATYRLKLTPKPQKKKRK